jgi:internalin A
VLSGLTSLTKLYLNNNSISDISALSGLTSLTYLNLYGNSISDISALSGLTSLTNLYLYNNSISDIQPLLDNSGLGAGDTVNLWFTNVSCTDVAALQAKGVTVYSDCS